MSLENAHSELLAAGIEALDSGITVFDAQLRLVAVNQRFFNSSAFRLKLLRLALPLRHFSVQRRAW